MSKEIKKIKDEINSLLFNGKSELSESEQERFKQLLLEEKELTDKVTYPYKMGGKFFIKLAESIQVPGTDEKTSIITVIGKDKINYIRLGGCTSNELLNAEGYGSDDDSDCWQSTSGYLTRAEAQKAINDFHIYGTVRMYGGCTCCGNYYEDPIDGLCKHYMYIEYINENSSNREKIEFINYMKYLRKLSSKENMKCLYESSTQKEIEHLEELLSEFNKKCNYNLKLEDLDDDNLIKRLFSQEDN